MKETEFIQQVFIRSLPKEEDWGKALKYAVGIAEYLTRSGYGFDSPPIAKPPAPAQTASSWDGLPKTKQQTPHPAYRPAQAAADKPAVQVLREAVGELRHFKQLLEMKPDNQAFQSLYQQALEKVEQLKAGQGHE